MADNNKSKMSERWAGLKAEFNKIVWADKKDVTKQSTAVVAVSVVVALMIVVLDAIIQYGVDFLISL